MSPFAAASELTLTPARAAIADSVSPGWTTYAPEVLVLAGTAVLVETDSVDPDSD